MGLVDRIRNMGRPVTSEQTDKLVVRQLQGRGADLAQPRHVIHFLYASSKLAAERAAEAIRGAGWDATVDPPAEETGDWIVRADGYRIVDSATVGSHRSWFEQVATEHGCEYDGWEAAAKP